LSEISPDSTQTDETRTLVRAGLDAWSVPYTANQIDQILLYRDLLVDWNSTRMNLTRLISPREIATEHFLDSLLLLTLVQIPQRASVLDIGPGAGFPTLPLRILRPDLRVTLLEATAKKLTFCKAVVDALGLRGVRLVHGRAEQPVAPTMLGAFDLVTARAVAPLDKLVVWSEPYAKQKSGVIAAYKGSRADEETEAAKSTLSRLKLSRSLPATNSRLAAVKCAIQSGMPHDDLSRNSDSDLEPPRRYSLYLSADGCVPFCSGRGPGH
jgi:16S rRNA (guanine527-N7)-methyltransferase